MKALLHALAVIVLCLCVLESCSTGPAPIRPGTPAFFWAAAHSAYRAGDYVKTNETLKQIVSTDNEYTQRARVWLLAVSSGLAQGYSDLADSYQAASRYNRSNPAGFRERVRTARSAASQLSLQAAETFRTFLDADKQARVALAFEYPSGTLAKPPELAKLNKGILLHGAEAEALFTGALRRGMLLEAGRLVGAPEDLTQAAEIFKNGSVSREQFVRGVAESLYEQSGLFGPKKLDQPQRMSALCILAEESLRSVPQSRKIQDLQGKLRKALAKRRMS